MSIITTPVTRHNLSVRDRLAESFTNWFLERFPTAWYRTMVKASCNLGLFSMNVMDVGKETSPDEQKVQRVSMVLQREFPDDGECNKHYEEVANEVLQLLSILQSTESLKSVESEAA